MLKEVDILVSIVNTLTKISSTKKIRWCSEFTSFMITSNSLIVLMFLFALERYTASRIILG